MNCIRCKKEIEEIMGTEKTCQTCFLELIENRARKTLSKQKLQKDDKILILEDKTKEFAVTNYLFRKIMANVPLKIEVKQKELTDLEKAKKEYTAVVVPADMDDEAERLITTMVNNGKLENDDTIKLLQNVYDREVKLFADIKKFTYAEQEKSKVQKALNKIEEKYPNSEFAILQSIKAMQKK